jgi:N-acetylglutamate synthase-like GNAT family acetyltransferase
LAEFTLRSATEADASSIRSLIRAVRINPTGLDWRRFILAVDPDGRMLGCGQVKPHHDGTRELASLAVSPEYRNHGIATAIMAHLMKENLPPLYLMCRSEMGLFYERFGFRALPFGEMPRYFQRSMKFSRIFLPIEILVMVYNGAGSSP